MIVTASFVMVEQSPLAVLTMALDRTLAPVREETTLSLEWLFKNHATDVHRIIARLLGPGASRSDIEDLTQQVFVAVHRGLPRFRGDSKVTTWLYGITSRTVLTYLRSRRRHHRMVETLEAIAEINPLQTEHLEAHLVRRDELRRVWSALMKIKPKKRVVFILYEVEGLTGKEIAEALSIKPATVFTRLYHARRELDAALKQMEQR